MKQQTTLFFAAVLLTSISALAIMPKSSLVIKDKTVSARGCTLMFANGKQRETLSGVLIGPNRIVTAAHADHFYQKLEIRCGDDLKKVKEAGRLTHPRYVKNDDPASVAAWGKYDIAIVGVNSAETAGLQPLPIISDINEIRSLIAQSRCIYGGAGDDNLRPGEMKKMVFIKTPSRLVLVSDTHAVVRHPGKPEVVSGDSGGPLLCQKLNNVWHLAGLINYSGIIKDKVTGVKDNIVAILVPRPELLTEFILK